MKPFKPDPKMSFKERARLGMELLAKQPPLTYEQMKEQADRVMRETKNQYRKKPK